MRRCLPKYSFRRLDEKESNKTLYPGLNLRCVKVRGQVHHIHILILFTLVTLIVEAFKRQRFVLILETQGFQNICVVM